MNEKHWHFEVILTHLAQDLDLKTLFVAGYLLARRKAIQLVSPLFEQEEVATSILVYGK